jgi:hypothetical protein
MANMNIITQKTGRVKDRSWDASKKALLSNILGFLDALKGYKTHVDNFDVPNINWKEVRPYLALEHFNVQAIETKNRAAAGLCAWVVSVFLHCCTLLYTVVHCCTLLYTVVHCCTLLYTVVHCCTLLYTVVHCSLLSFAVLHCVFLHCVLLSLSFIPLHWSSLVFHPYGTSRKLIENSLQLGTFPFLFRFCSVSVPFQVNIVKYHDTIVSVEPKRQALSEANARLAAANEKLEKVNAHVADLARKLKILTDELEAANAQKKEAVDLVETSQLRLDLAQRLTGALGR